MASKCVTNSTRLPSVIYSLSCFFFYSHFRINKKGSQKDQEQKKSGAYFFYDAEEEDDDDDDFDDI